MKLPRLLALMLALPMAVTFAASSARVAELRESLSTDDPEALKAMAIELVSRNEQDQALLDVVADRIAMEQGTQDAALSDALAWLCRPFANARAGRYKQFLDKVSDTAGTVRLRHYAAVVAVGLPDPSGPSYQLPSDRPAPKPAPVAVAPPVASASQTAPPADPPPKAPKAEPKSEPKSERKLAPVPVPVAAPAVAVAPAAAPKAQPPAPRPAPAAPAAASAPTPKPAPASAPVTVAAAPMPAAAAPVAAATPAAVSVGGTYRLRSGAQLRTRPLGSGLALDADPGAVRLTSSTRNAEGTWWFAKGERASGWVREADLTAP